MQGIVIVGAGQAAGQAAASLRQEGHKGAITLIGEEAQPPYQRPPLSKQYLAGELEAEKLHLRPERFYADQGIELLLGTRVEALDTQGQSVATSDGKRHEYGQLLLATGSRPRRLALPGAELPGIHYLRTVADVDAIRAALPDARRLCIVGGGYIGLEVAAVAATAGLEVTLLEMESRILQRVTTPEMSAYYQQLHASRGVQIRTGAQVTGFAGDGKLAQVLCEGGESLEADLVIVGIGILPNVELAEAAGLACGNGILVDERCRTSDPHIYAAGDCTNHPNALLGRRLRLESVPNAMEQARVAASAMTGGDKAHAALPWFWSDQYEHKLQMAGFSSDAEESVLRGDPAANQFAVFYLKAGALVAVDAVNSPRDFMAAKQLYGKPVDRAALADPGTDLKTLLVGA